MAEPIPLGLFLDVVDMHWPSQEISFSIVGSAQMEWAYNFVNPGPHPPDGTMSDFVVESTDPRVVVQQFRTDEATAVGWLHERTVVASWVGTPAKAKRTVITMSFGGASGGAEFNGVGSFGTGGWDVLINASGSNIRTVDGFGVSWGPSLVDVTLPGGSIAVTFTPSNHTTDLNVRGFNESSTGP